MTAAARTPRSRWRPAGLAWTLWAVAILGLAVLIWLDQLLRQTGRPELVVLVPSAFPPVLGALSTATVGAVLASRRPPEAGHERSCAQPRAPSRHHLQFRAGPLSCC